MTSVKVYVVYFSPPDASLWPTEEAKNEAADEAAEEEREARAAGEGDDEVRPMITMRENNARGQQGGDLAASASRGGT